MIMIAYDGSADAQVAIDRAAQLMPGAQATVLTVWEPFFDAMERNGSSAGMGMGVGWSGTYADSQAIDDASLKAAEATAAEGATRAVAAGLDATSRSATRAGGIAFTILAEAEAVDAELVVMGTRGLGGVKSFLLGSVSHDVVQHADRAVLIVPTLALAKHRNGHIAGEAIPA